METGNEARIVFVPLPRCHPEFDRSLPSSKLIQGEGGATRSNRASKVGQTPSGGGKEGCGGPSTPKALEFSL